MSNDGTLVSTVGLAQADSATAVAMIARVRQMDKNAIKWTRLSCGKFRNNEVRLQLHALANKIARTAWAMMARCTYYQEPVSQGRGLCRTVDLAAESGPYSSPDNRLVSVGGAWRDGCEGGAEQMKGNDDRR